MKVGEWVRRQRLDTWHRIESVVAEDAVTRCGRRMGNEATKTGGRLIVVETFPITYQICSRCA